MDPKFFGIIEMLIFTGLALGFGIWQYVSVSRELRKTKDEAAREDDPTPR